MDWSFGRKKQKEQKEGMVGVFQTSTGISAVYGVTAGSKTTVKAFVFEEANQPDKKQAAILKFVTEHQLQGVPCTYVLGLGEYTLNLVDEPAVPKEEIAKAMRWIVRDLINFPIEEAVIDTVELPFVRARDNAKMVYAAAVKKSIMLNVEAFIAPTGLVLQTIDIPELALNNIITQRPDREKGCAFLRLSSHGGKLILVKNKQLCVARSFELKLDELGKDHDQDIKTLESLALEVQRSFDYINSVFRQSIQNHIVIAPTKIDKAIVQEFLKSSLGAEVVSLTLAEAFSVEPVMTEEEEAETLIAAGALLRAEGQTS